MTAAKRALKRIEGQWWMSVADIVSILKEEIAKDSIAQHGYDRCPEFISGEQCGRKRGHEGKHVWLRGD